jgi:nucleotide-binding universal stress UspA family protein
VSAPHSTPAGSSLSSTAGTPAGRTASPFRQPKAVWGIVILTTGRHLLTPAAQPGLQPPQTVPEPVPAPGWVLLAVDGSPGAAAVTDRAARVAAARGVGVEVMHVRETDVIDTEAVELEPAEYAERIVAARLAQLADLGVPATPTSWRRRVTTGTWGALSPAGPRRSRPGWSPSAHPPATGR